MACGIPLITSPWRDTENLFTEGKDYLMARNSEEMKSHLLRILHDNDFATHLYEHALKTISDKHTCDHRAEELEIIAATIQPEKIKNKDLLAINKI